MKQAVKNLFVMLGIVMCLVSDTALSATQVQNSRLKVQESARRLSMNSVAFAGTGRRLPSWECRNWTPPLRMLLCE